jgi:hypothetical protein
MGKFVTRAQKNGSLLQEKLDEIVQLSLKNQPILYAHGVRPDLVKFNKMFLVTLPHA